MIAFDANVLVYAYADQSSEKYKRAREAIDRGMRSGVAILPLQTLAEFSNVAMRRYRTSPDDVNRILRALHGVAPVEAATELDLAAALDAVRDHKLSFWDAMLWATAARIGATHLFSEDFQDGRVLGPVRFVNPFAAKNDALIDALLPR